MFTQSLRKSAQPVGAHAKAIVCSKNIKELLNPGRLDGMVIPVAGLKNLQVKTAYGGIEYPERRKLRFVEKVPQYPTTIRPPKYQKCLYYMRGPEEVHNQLVHKQFGIVAEQPGRLRFGHFEMLRLTLGRKINQTRMFAVWRVDPPWQAVTKKGQGQRMGGGKGSIDHYVTPVKTGRIIIEFGGACEFDEVKPFLTQVANQLPFKAKPVSYESMIAEAKEKKRKEESNVNPYTFKYVIQNNLGNCHNWISTYDRKWFGEHM